MTKDVEKVVLILKLLQDARNIDKNYNTLPAIIANRDMIIQYDVVGYWAYGYYDPRLPYRGQDE